MTQLHHRNRQTRIILCARLRRGAGIRNKAAPSQNPIWWCWDAST